MSIFAPRPTGGEPGNPKSRLLSMAGTAVLAAALTVGIAQKASSAELSWGGDGWADAPSASDTGGIDDLLDGIEGMGTGDTDDTDDTDDVLDEILDDTDTPVDVSSATSDDGDGPMDRQDRKAQRALEDIDQGVERQQDLAEDMQFEFGERVSRAGADLFVGQIQPALLARYIEDGTVIPINGTDDPINLIAGVKDAEPGRDYLYSRLTVPFVRYLKAIGMPDTVVLGVLKEHKQNNLDALQIQYAQFLDQLAKEEARLDALYREYLRTIAEEEEALRVAQEEQIAIIQSQRGIQIAVGAGGKEIETAAHNVETLGAAKRKVMLLREYIDADTIPNRATAEQEYTIEDGFLPPFIEAATALDETKRMRDKLGEYRRLVTTTDNPEDLILNFDTLFTCGLPWQDGIGLMASNTALARFRIDQTQAELADLRFEEEEAAHQYQCDISDDPDDGNPEWVDCEQGEAMRQIHEWRKRGYRPSRQHELIAENIARLTDAIGETDSSQWAALSDDDEKAMQWKLRDLVAARGEFEDYEIVLLREEGSGKYTIQRDTGVAGTDIPSSIGVIDDEELASRATYLDFDGVRLLTGDRQWIKPDGFYSKREQRYLEYDATGNPLLLAQQSYPTKMVFELACRILLSRTSGRTFAWASQEGGKKSDRNIRDLDGGRIFQTALDDIEATFRSGEIWMPPGQAINAMDPVTTSSDLARVDAGIEGVVARAYRELGYDMSGDPIHTTDEMLEYMIMPHLATRMRGWSLGSDQTCDEVGVVPGEHATPVLQDSNIMEHQTVTVISNAVCDNIGAAMSQRADYPGRTPQDPTVFWHDFPTRDSGLFGQKVTHVAFPASNRTTAAIFAERDEREMVGLVAGTNTVIDQLAGLEAISVGRGKGRGGRHLVSFFNDDARIRRKVERAQRLRDRQEGGDE